jgi:hypothetical protein
VAVADNFYCDKTEISNIDWREYMYRIRKVFGPDSEEYQAALPDSTALAEFIPCFDDFYGVLPIFRTVNRDL